MTEKNLLKYEPHGKGVKPKTTRIFESAEGVDLTLVATKGNKAERQGAAQQLFKTMESTDEKADPKWNENVPED